MKQGFSLIELLIIISLVGIFAVGGTIYLLKAKNKKSLDSMVQIIVADIRATMERSKSQEESNQWGIHFDNPVGAGNDFYEMWNGVDYPTGTKVSRAALSSGLEFTDPASGASKEAVFAKATGLPAANVTVIINSIADGNSKTITIDTNGKIDY